MKIQAAFHIHRHRVDIRVTSWDIWDCNEQNVGGDSVGFHANPPAATKPCLRFGARVAFETRGKKIELFPSVLPSHVSRIRRDEKRGWI